jgi:hypothetical protein
MFRSTACRQLTHATAILALALLCAQTLVVVHEHQISEHELCVVCSATAEHTDAPSLANSDSVWIASSTVPTIAPAIPAEPIRTSHRARAPPIG